MRMGMKVRKSGWGRGRAVEDGDEIEKSKLTMRT
jgi:hypothetical protein